MSRMRREDERSFSSEGNERESRENAGSKARRNGGYWKDEESNGGSSGYVDFRVPGAPSYFRKGADK
jgi:hypothetical protein